MIFLKPHTDISGNYRQYREVFISNDFITSSIRFGTLMCSTILFHIIIIIIIFFLKFIMY